MTWKTSKLIMGFIWIFSIIDMIPNLVFYRIRSIEVTPSQFITICEPNWPSLVSWKIYLVVGNILFCYTVPLMLIVTCYVLIGYRVWNRDAPGVYRSNGVVRKSKVRVVKMLGLVVLVFALSWLPLWVCHIRLTFFTVDPATRDTLYRYVIPISQWLGLSNSGINPIIYCLFSKRIRLRIKAMLQCQTRRQEMSRYQSRFSSTRYVSVDYTNGQITLRTCGNDKRVSNIPRKRSNGNIYD
ncbi:hypothetical protein FSP39_019107 [Pinctada imbricata]|uniref:G-protein coupled receptors family 1 profile domain-containing protein n=1 Tax=Pinctada imbricata TaxID=66713 RepID=A0AA88XZY3_PINIB|nr:hypothetical protein FSP39_019107 [Pinctada imbricata]